MPDFELIDTRKFLKSPITPSKTSKTPERVRDGETYVSELRDSYQQNPAKPPATESEGVLLGSHLEVESKSYPVPDAQNSFAGFAGSIGEGTKQKGVRLESRSDTIPHLPFALERLVSAASSNLLSGFTFDGVPDINNYVRGLACDYIVGDQQHALDRLHQVQVARELSR